MGKNITIEVLKLGGVLTLGSLNSNLTKVDFIEYFPCSDNMVSTVF